MKDLLTTLWRAWKRIGMLIGDVIARIVLTLFYFTIFVPFGLGFRLSGRRKKRVYDAARLWVRREKTEDDLKMAQRLF